MMAIVMGWRSVFPKRREIERIEFKSVDELTPWLRHAVALLDAADPAPQTSDNATAARWEIRAVDRVGREVNGIYTVEETFLNKVKKMYMPEGKML